MCNSAPLQQFVSLAQIDTESMRNIHATSMLADQWQLVTVVTGLMGHQPAVHVMALAMLKADSLNLKGVHAILIDILNKARLTPKNKQCTFWRFYQAKATFADRLEPRYADRHVIA